jgi:regulatory protein
MAPPKHSAKPVTEASLLQAAIWYVERYAGNSRSVRDALWRRVRASEPEVDRALTSGWIDGIVHRLEDLGYVNDEAWAESKARTLLGRGVPPSMIRQRLRLRGIDEPGARNALAGLEEESPVDPELRAAVAYVRRRRFGPYRNPEQRADRRLRDLGATCRAGFSYRVAERVIDAVDVEALERLVAVG